MKKKALLMFLVIVVSSLVLTPGCIRIVLDGNEIVGSSNVVTRDYDFDGFNRLEVGSAFEVHIVQSDSFEVSIKMNDNLFDYLEISQDGSTLKIRMKPNYSFRQSTREASVSIPAISALDLSGASRGDIAGFTSTDDLWLELSGASNLELLDMKAGDTRSNISGASRLTGDIEISDADFDISGASRVSLVGKCDYLELDVSGASSARLGDFPAITARVNLSGASNGDIEVTDELDVQLSGASRLTYSGDPTLKDVDVSGGSSLNKK